MADVHLFCDVWLRVLDHDRRRCRARSASQAGVRTARVELCEDRLVTDGEVDEPGPRHLEVLEHGSPVKVADNASGQLPWVQALPTRKRHDAVRLEVSKIGPPDLRIERDRFIQRRRDGLFQAVGNGRSEWR